MTSLEDCRVIDLPRHRDSRGSLSFVENGSHVPFDIERVYYLYDVPKGAGRGGHGHKQLQQLIVSLSGCFDVILDDGFDSRVYRLDNPYTGLYVCPMMWRTLENFSPGAVCLVLASLRYDEADYFRDYSDFLKAREVSR